MSRATTGLAAANPARILATGVFFLLIISSGYARAQLRYVGSIDVTGQYVSNPTAGMPEWDSNYDGINEEPAKHDFVTEISPALRLYFNWPRNLLFIRYQAGLQLHANTPNTVLDSNGVPETGDGRLFTYTNAVHTGYSHLFSHVTEIALTNHLSQGSSAATVSPYIADGQVVNGFQTVGSSFITDNLRLAVGHQIGSQWAIRTRLSGDVFVPYDRWYSDQAGTLPPPLTFGVNLGGETTRQFSLGMLRIGADWSYLGVYRDRGLTGDPFRGMEETQHGFVVGVNAGWVQPISQVWTAWVGGGIDMRIRQNETETGTPGYNDPEPGPVADAGIRFRWQQSFGGSLGYGFGTRRILENQVSTLAQAHNVGLDLYYTHQMVRVDLVGSFRHVTNRVDSDQEDNDADATITGRVRAGLSYGIIPGISVEMAYALEIVSNQLVRVREDDGTLGLRSIDDYTQHRAIVGLSLVWPPPPPQAQRLRRRDSEYEPMFLRMDQPGAGDNEQGGSGLTDSGRARGHEDASQSPIQNISPVRPNATPTTPSSDPLPRNTDPLPRGSDPLPRGSDPTPDGN